MNMPVAPGLTAALDYLRSVLGRVRRARETPLHFGIDAGELALAARDDVFGARPPTGNDLAILLANLGALVNEALSDDPVHASPVPGDAPPPLFAVVAAPDWNHRLAAWLDALYNTARHTHPRAIDVLALRVEGWDDREIARKLNLGLRLTNRIRIDLVVALQPRGHEPC